MSSWYEDNAQSIGRTPLVRLNRVIDGAQATVLVHGAHLVSWIPAGGEEQLYLSPAAKYGLGASVRGGVPVMSLRLPDVTDEQTNSTPAESGNLKDPPPRPSLLPSYSAFHPLPSTIQWQGNLRICSSFGSQFRCLPLSHRIQGSQ